MKTLSHKYQTRIKLFALSVIILITAAITFIMIIVFDEYQSKITTPEHKAVVKK